MITNPNVRKAILLGTPVVALVVVATTSLVLAGELPAEVPSNWQGRRATETMALLPHTLVMGALVLVIGLGAQALRHRLGEPTSQRVLGAAGVGVSAALAALHVGTMLAVRGQEAPYTLPWGVLVVAGVLLLAAGSLGAAAVHPVERHGARIEPTPLTVAPGEAVVWTGTATAPWGAWLLLAAATALAVTAVLADLPWVALLLVALVVAASTLLRVTVTVGPAGVTARMGPLRLVRFHTALEEVEEVHAEVVDPLTYGGWGLRWLPGVRGVVLRTGPGLRIEQAEGPDLVVTVDGAAEAAGVLQAHLRAVPR